MRLPPRVDADVALAQYKYTASLGSLGLRALRDLRDLRVLRVVPGAFRTMASGFHRLRSTRGVNGLMSGKSNLRHDFFGGS